MTESDDIAPRDRRANFTSMNLLLEVMDHPLDQSYVEAKERRRHRRPSPISVVVWTVIAVVIGVCVAAALAYLRAPLPAAIQARTLLAQEITERRERADEVAATNDSLQDEISRLSSEVLYGSGGPTIGRDLDDALALGSTAVKGPGVIVTLSDGPDSASNDAARVQDSDIQVVVNELWNAGAEAIAVNGIRLGPTSAIRGAGGAVLVDLVGLSPPYEISALGSSNNLQVELARSSTADHLSQLGATFGIGVRVTGESQIELPAARVPTLAFATALVQG